MSQCVPSWDLDDNSFPFHVPSYEVAELTWQNGQLALHGHANKPPPPPPPLVAGTLESIVNQTAFHFAPKSAAVNSLAPWFDHREQQPAPAFLGTDALVPVREHAVLPEAGGVESTLVGSCSGATVPGSRSVNGVSKETWGRRRVRNGRELTATEITSFDTFGAELGGTGCTSASVWSEENTSSGKEYAKTTSGDDPDSISHSTPQIQTIDDGEVQRGKKIGKFSSGSTKRSRSAAVHSQSERRRRDRINQRMKTLQKMVPNSSKTDKASMLDEVIDYIKQLQGQIQLANLCMSQVMMMQQYLHMSAMHGMGVMHLNTVGRTVGMPPPVMPPTAATGMPPIIPTAAFMPMAPWNVQGDRLSSPDLFSTLLSNPMGMDAFSRLAAMYQQYPQALGPKK